MAENDFGFMFNGENEDIKNIYSLSGYIFAKYDTLSEFTNIDYNNNFYHNLVFYNPTFSQPMIKCLYLSFLLYLYMMNNNS